ncbi:restriction endonuclease [Priestia megaterium]|uniref:Restriction endonuclease n=1 Tax=Priestia megaterium TaxID=1404 RepID=A0A3D8WWT6_PRIMG|nr:HNH endonuclease [Priestia megaterium]MDH3168931.1 HNH endonuclease [Priestia megaterium]RDZ10376.1 restriction endonuclease [Priestia megaterium]
MSFEHGLQPSGVLTNQELMSTFKCAMAGGMRFSHRTNTLVLISDHTKSLYDDRWIGDVFHYTGMGKAGDQSLEYSQNKKLCQSSHTNVTVYLFEVFKQNHYVFLGEVYLSNNPYKEEQLGENKELRFVWVFPLRLKKKQDEILIPTEFFESREKIQEKEAKKMTQDELTKRVASASKKPGSRKVVTKAYERDIYVSEYAKRRANGVCQLCEEPAPFHTKKGDPYLETHHIEWLSKGGADTIENTVALCPNCHRKMHSLNSKKDVEKLRVIASKR